MSPSLEAEKPGLEWKERLLLEEGQTYSNALTGASLPLCRPQIPKLCFLDFVRISLGTHTDTLSSTLELELIGRVSCQHSVNMLAFERR